MPLKFNLSFVYSFPDFKDVRVEVTNQTEVSKKILFQVNYKNTSDHFHMDPTES